MIVILEGVDGSGKTTLAKQLKENGYETVLISPSGGKDEYLSWLQSKSMFKNKVVVSDRSFITDLAYRCYDLEPRKGMDLQQICKVLSNEIKIIYLESGSEYDDSMSRGEDNITSRYVNRKIKENYRTIIDMLTIFTDVPIFVYNWKKQKVSHVINFIKGGINNEPVSV